VHRLVRRAATSVQVERFRCLMARQDLLEVTVAEEDPSAKEVVRNVSSSAGDALNQVRS
jgi:hypothetical protein